METIRIKYLPKINPTPQIVVAHSQDEVDDIVQKVVRYGYRLYSVERLNDQERR